MKRLNGYAYVAGAKFYEHTPKAVWAALAISFADRLDQIVFADPDPDTDGKALDFLIEEWECLHESGILPQPPPRRS